MSWKAAGNLAARNHASRGVGASVAAGLVCQEAERLYPGLYKAVSLRNGTLKLAISPENLVACKLVEGDILARTAAFAKERSLPVPTRIRLTDVPVSASL